MVVKISFASPADDEVWDKLIINRATTPTGTFSLRDTIPAKTSDGKWVTSYIDTTGVSGNAWTVTPFDSINTVYGTESEIITVAIVGYLTVKEARLMGKFQPIEFDDETMELYILQATEDLEQRTGRTWNGVQTVTNQYYDGNGMNYLQLPHCDIQSLTALSVSNNNDGTFTSVTVSKVTWYEAGAVILDSNMHSDLEATVFTKGNKTVLVSYTHGNAVPTQSVKQLCLLLLHSIVKVDASIENQIAKKVERLKNKGVHFV
jgi:hypothetical protein